MDVPIATRAFPVWRTLRFVVGIIAALLIVLMAGMMIVDALTGNFAGAARPVNSGSRSENIPEIISYVSLALLTLLALRRLSGTTLYELGLRALHRRDLAVVAIAIAGTFAFGVVYDFALRAIGIHQHTQAGFETFHPHGRFDQLAVIAAAVLVAPVAEELFFRGLLFNAFRKWFGAPLAVVVSSALFGLVHGDAVLFAELMVNGMVACVVYSRTRNLYAPMIVHGANNLLAVSLLLLQN